jgi:hypothetical protein
MPGKYGSSAFGVLLIDGYNLLSAKLQSFAHKIRVPQQKTDGLGDSWDEHTPTGIRGADISQDGAFFDTNANAIHQAMKDTPQTPRVLAFAPAGNAIGSIFVGAAGVATVGYEVLAQQQGLTRANATYEITGQVDEGVILSDHATRTADWTEAAVDYAANVAQVVVPITSNSAANPSVVTTPVPHGLATGDIIVISGVAGSSLDINGERVVTVLSATTFSVPVNVTVAGTGGSFVRANSSFGGVGYQAVSDFTGLTGFVGKIRDSADNLTFADLITFANVTGAPAAERIEVAGVIDRYVLYDGNVTGTGSLKPFVGFRRKAS